MSYVDDWGATSPDDRARLEQPCEEPTCAHMRYLHGDARTVRNGPYRWIEHTAGKCTNCTCATFRGEPPITKDEVLDLAVALRYDVHLHDIGIAAISQERCQVVTIRHAGLLSTSRMCTLDKGHIGDHAPNFSEGT